MLAKHLVEEFDEYFGRDSQHDTILWLDPHREWEGLLPNLESQLPLLAFEGSQLHVRYRLASRSPGERFVVYLPMAQDDAAYLRPFFYTSRCFERSIEAVLRDLKVALPEDSTKMRAIRPLLPALAVASVGKGQGFWNSIVNLETALGRLIPDFEDQLLRFLASPAQGMAELDSKQTTGPFFDLLKGQFGSAPLVAGEEEAWADRFTATLCLVDTSVAAGEPTGFPFQNALPAPVHWESCRNFLRKWQRDDMFKAAFARRAKAVDAEYSLASWVDGLSQPPKTSAFLNVERAVWDGMLSQLDGITDKPGAVAFCRKNQASFRRRAQGFWAREGSMSGWSVLDRMAAVVTGARDALKEVSSYDTAQLLMDRYTGTWWQVDRAYRLFRAELDQGVTQVDAALKWAQRMYQEFLEAVNNRFGEALMQEGLWPPAGMALGAGDLWVDSPPAGQARRGIILADALRYELGKALGDLLRTGPQAGVESALCPLPSVTSLGMAALLPGWPDFEVDYAGGQWTVSAPGFDENVATKVGRLAWLARRLGSTAAYDLDAWLTTPLTEVPKEARWIVISSTEIDAVGEGAATVAWHAFEALLGRLDQAVRRLLALGCEEVHIVSDHGFLLRESIGEADKVAVKAGDPLKRAERYLVGRSLPPTDLPALPVPGSDGLVAWFPRGIGCFLTPGPYNYMHGGISLQELVTAHVTVRQAVTERPVGVALELTTGPEIRNAIFKVRLVPEGVDLWTRARQVTIDIAREGNRVSPVWEAEVDRDVVEKSLRLEPDSGLTVGDDIAVRIWDAITGELLGQQPATVYVDPDL